MTNFGCSPSHKMEGTNSLIQRVYSQYQILYYSFIAFESEFPEREYDDGNYGPNAYPGADYGREEYHENYEPYRYISIFHF